MSKQTRFITRRLVEDNELLEYLQTLIFTHIQIEQISKTSLTLNSS